LNPTGLQDVTLEEWEEAEGMPGRQIATKIKEAVLNYIWIKCASEKDAFPTPDHKICQIAEKLVRKCRHREAYAADGTSRTKKR